MGKMGMLVKYLWDARQVTATIELCLGGFLRVGGRAVDVDGCGSCGVWRRRGVCGYIPDSVTRRVTATIETRCSPLLGMCCVTSARKSRALKIWKLRCGPARKSALACDNLSRVFVFYVPFLNNGTVCERGSELRGRVDANPP
jgi:hypothetical protein